MTDRAGYGDPPITGEKRCGCHGRPMRWTTDRRKRAGGVWRCRVLVAASHARYERRPKGRERKRRYQTTDHAKSIKELYELTRIRAT